MAVILKTPEQIQYMAEAGAINGIGLKAAMDAAEPGISTQELNDIFETTIRGLGAIPCILGFEGYTKSICTSINDQVVHAIPSKDVILKKGDIIGIDVGVRYKGYCSDMARTVAVGHISKEAQELLWATESAMNEGIEYFVPGNTIGDIGYAVQQYAKKAGLGVVRSLVGHGIGTEMHEEPALPNYGKPGDGLTLEVGMVLAIEPMFTTGSHEVIFEQDGWTVRTADGSLAAHFENTVAITKDGPLILSVLP
jgi:methionyl aminopeptidase